MSRPAIIPKYSHRGVAISIYSSGTRFSAQFVINGGKPDRIERGSEFQALEAARQKIDGLIQYNVGAENERSAEEILRPWNLTVVQAACLVDRALTKLSPLKAEMENAVQFFVEHHSGESIAVNEAVDELIEQKRRDTGKHNARDLESRLKKRFCLDFGNRLIHDISRAEISKWLQKLPHAKRGRRNFHTAIVTLFRWARSNGYLPEDKPTAAESTEKPRAGLVTKDIYTPDDLRGFIRAALKLDGSGLLPLVIQAFAGVRSEELCNRDSKKDRLCWSDITLHGDEPEIHVRAEVAKVGIERYVFIPAALASWLELCGQSHPKGPICIGSELWKIYSKLSEAAEIRWKKNGWRKSFNTYHSALSGVLEETADEAGNSEGMIRQYYRKPISRAKSTAKEWFSLGTWAFKDEVTAYLKSRQMASVSAKKVAWKLRYSAVT